MPRTPFLQFCDRAEDYVKYRPSYPAAAIDIILEGMVSPSQQLHTRFCDQRGIVSLLYSTSVFLAKPQPSTHSPKK